MTPPRASLDRHAAAYESSFPYHEENHLMLAAYAQRIACHIEALALPARMLSLGIGHAAVVQRMLRLLDQGHLARYVVVDGSPKIIQRLRDSLAQPAPGLELIEGYFEEFGCNGRFEVVEAGFVLEHVDDPASILERLRPFLAEHGRLFAAVPNARSLHRLLGHHAGFLDDLYALSDADRALGHQRYFDADSIVRLFERCGYRVERLEGLMLKPLTTSQLQSLQLPAAVWQALVGVACDHPDIANAVYLEAVA